MTQPRSQSEADLQQIQKEFKDRWRIWRPRYWIGQRPGLWCATRLDYEAGVSPTVVRDTANGLRNALLAEADKADHRVKRSW